MNVERDSDVQDVNYNKAYDVEQCQVSGICPSHMFSVILAVFNVRLQRPQVTVVY